MINTNDALAAALNDFGIQPLINGVQSDVWIMPYLDGSTVYDGERINHSGPYALAMDSEIRTLALVTGDRGDTLTIAGTEYTLLTIDPDGLGGVVLRLEEQP